MNATEIELFLDEYGDATNDVASSSSATIDTNLDRWFDVLNDSPEVSKIIADLESRVNFSDWYEKEAARNTGMGGDLRWPSGKENRIAMQVLAFRAMRAEKPDLLNFHHQFMNSSSHQMDTIVYEVVSQIFNPMARDLQKYLVTALAKPTADPPSQGQDFSVPASDRAVPLDHNNPDYVIATRDLEIFEEAVRGSNDLEIDDKEQRLAELGAMRLLLHATKARADVLISLVHKGLLYFAKTFADKAVGALALGLIALLGRLTGLW
jgi:hypothetical protein